VDRSKIAITHLQKPSIKLSQSAFCVRVTLATFRHRLARPGRQSLCPSNTTRGFEVSQAVHRKARPVHGPRGAILEPGENLLLDFTMEMLVLHESITVKSSSEQLDPSDTGRLTLTRDSPGATLPTNGRDFQASFDLIPGIVVTPPGVGDAGRFTSNGQRPNANSFRVDGVSVNTGAGGSALPGSLPGASLPAMTAIGTTENLVSPETTQTMELRTSGFAPEFGERPGAAAEVTTRAGSNQFHADFFGHVRDNGWTARDWFANSLGIPFARPRYSDIGEVFGGPILRNRTFIFVSAERSTLYFSGLQLTPVPSIQSRANAPAVIQQVLNSFALPTGPELGNGVAAGILAFNTTASLSNYSLRIDQSLGRSGNLFGRVVESPSSSSDSGCCILNSGRHNWKSVTVGITAGQSTGVIHDIRFNYARDHLSTHLSDIWGVFSLAALDHSNPPPGLIQNPDAVKTVLGLSITGFGQFIGGVMGNPQQDQREIRYTMAKETPRHRFRAGVDYTRLDASRDFAGASVLGTASSLESLLSGGPLAVTWSTTPKSGDSVQTSSLFAQDTFHAGERFSLVYGGRWELSPPVRSRSPTLSVSGLLTGTDLQVTNAANINVTGPWPMRWGQFAPRVGAVYRLPGQGLVLRAGAGVFYDTALGSIINPINGAPFNSWQLASGTSGNASSPGAYSSGPRASGSLSPDVERFLHAPLPSIYLPTSLQWRVSVEKGMGARGLASIAYIGAVGRNLLGNEGYVDPGTGIMTRFATVTANSSNYQALQFRYTGSLGHSVYGSASYAWSHSIDDGSQDSSAFLIHPGYRLDEARGSSSFDVRHALTASLSLRIPRSSRFGWLPEGLVGWTVSGILRVRSGFPVDIMDAEPGLGRGFDNAGRPDVVPGMPIWIDDQFAAGHRRLNSAAFRVPPVGISGSLGRNVITGNGLAQLDVSVMRDFPIYRRASLEVGVSLFNALNHPAFADPVPYLANPFFGQSTSMQNLMFGSGTPNTGSPPIFQTGGSRSAELSFRVSF